MPRDLPAHLWVSALVRRAELGGAFAVIAHRGDADRGDVLVKVSPTRGRAQLYAPVFALEGPTTFGRVFAEAEDAPETDVDAQIARRLKADRDLWVIEIEDRQGRHFLVEPVE
jgi:hypothetical protein